jgi:hypothetical protein
VGLEVLDVGCLLLDGGFELGELVGLVVVKNFGFLVHVAQVFLPNNVDAHVGELFAL